MVFGFSERSREFLPLADYFRKFWLFSFIMCLVTTRGNANGEIPVARPLIEVFNPYFLDKKVDLNCFLNLFKKRGV